jgi:hypothetical protein
MDAVLTEPGWFNRRYTILSRSITLIFFPAFNLIDRPTIYPWPFCRKALSDVLAFHRRLISAEK